MNHVKTFAILACLAGGLAACGSTSVAPEPAPAMSMPVAAPAPALASMPAAAPAPALARVPVAPAPKQMAASAVATVTLPAYLDPKNSLSTQRSLYFEFDEYTVGVADLPFIERHGKFLASHPKVAIRIEGHTDERGGTEYNLALGQKRAESLLRALRNYGVKNSQMEAVSWGESKPREAGHEEAAWKLNRRADLQYPSQ